MRILLSCLFCGEVEVKPGWSLAPTVTITRRQKQVLLEVAGFSFTNDLRLSGLQDLRPQLRLFK